MKSLVRFVLFGLFWLGACIPVTGQQSPLPTSLPTETSTPLPEDTELVTYQDTKHKFEVAYSKGIFTPPIEDSNAGILVLVMDVGKLFAGQNLENVTVTISAGPSCRFKDIYIQKKPTGEESINDIPFSVYSTRDAETTGNIFQTIVYQTYHNDLCYEIRLHMREYSLTAFPDVSEYDPEIIIIEFKNLLSTFKFIE